MYNGVPDKSGEIKRMSLEDAAVKVGVSKKSLDDYILQLRQGKKYGFDFEKHRHEKIGVLRKFNREQK